MKYAFLIFNLNLPLYSLKLLPLVPSLTGSGKKCKISPEMPPFQQMIHYPLEPFPFTASKQLTSWYQVRIWGLGQEWHVGRNGWGGQCLPQCTRGLWRQYRKGWERNTAAFPPWGLLDAQNTLLEPQRHPAPQTTAQKTAAGAKNQKSRLHLPWTLPKSLRGLWCSTGPANPLRKSSTLQIPSIMSAV